LADRESVIVESSEIIMELGEQRTKIGENHVDWLLSCEKIVVRCGEPMLAGGHPLEKTYGVQ